MVNSNHTTNSDTKSSGLSRQSQRRCKNYEAGWSQKWWGRAEAEAESLRPSQAKTDGRWGKAKVRQAEKLPRGGLEPRELPRGLHFWEISRKLLETEAQHQWITNRKWLQANQTVTWSMMSHDPERSRSWSRYVWNTLSQKQLEIQTLVQWSTYWKWHPLYQMVSGHMTDDVTWLWKVKVMPQIYLDANVSKTVKGRDSIARCEQITGS